MHKFEILLDNTIIAFEKETNDNNLHRYYSFDHCYSYFYNNNAEYLSKNMQLSCSVLGFYLASWGMLRGSSFLLQNNSTFYKKLVECIKNKKDKEINWWQIELDAESYVDRILELYKDLEVAINDEKLNQKASETLITKIMLGVFGCFPALDQYFKSGLKEVLKGAGQIEKKAKKIQEYYVENKKLIDNARTEFKVKSFDNKLTELTYPPAKLIDMIGFCEGMRISNRKTKTKTKIN